MMKPQALAVLGTLMLCQTGHAQSPFDGSYSGPMTRVRAARADCVPSETRTYKITQGHLGTQLFGNLTIQPDGSFSGQRSDRLAGTMTLSGKVDGPVITARYTDTGSGGCEYNLVLNKK